MTIRVALLDDNPIFRFGIRSALAAFPEFLIVAEGKCESDAIEIVNQSQPDLILIDPFCPSMDGIFSIFRISKNSNNAKIVVLTEAKTSCNFICVAKRINLYGYLNKNIDPFDLKEALHFISNHEKLMFYDYPENCKHCISLTPLTNSEISVMMEVIAGASEKEIANRFQIRLSTVRRHVSRILTKLNMKSRIEVISYFFNKIKYTS